MLRPTLALPVLLVLPLLAPPPGAPGAAPGAAPPDDGVPRAALREAPKEGSDAANALRTGLELLAKGQRAEAVAPLREALRAHPFAPPILRALLEATAGDPQRQPLWAHRYALALIDEQGRIERKHLGAFGQDPWPARLAEARAAAVQELARHAATLRPGPAAAGNEVLAAWARGFAALLTREAPALAARHLPEIESVGRRLPPEPARVIDALKSLCLGPPATTGPLTDAQRAELDRALRAALCLAGMAAQAGFGKDLQGPEPPDTKELARFAREARARLRARIDAEAGEPWTVERLLELDEAGRRAFTQRHRQWSNPATGVSPKGRYRVQTICGFETLLGALQTVELHHERLAGWYGKDPFADQQGLVRIVPDAADLEAEDAPFWWAGGFQSGPVTTLGFAFGTIEGLGRGLTHELTHRFDGTLLPFLPAWATEGRAVWTGKAYGKSEDTEFRARHLDPWYVQGPFVKGYGDPAKLRTLLEGKLDDYRDNYSAGYALYTFLATWEAEERPLFAAPLQRYFANARAAGKDPVGHFVRHFADGKEGRPESFEAFAALFRGFLEGCYQHAFGQPPPWMGRYVLALTGKMVDPRITDEPTWTWSRDRAEPWFGQGHARRAAHLLAEAGHRQGALAALALAFATDEWTSADASLQARLLEQQGRRDAAWAVRRRNALQDPREPDPGPAPFAGALPRVQGLLRLLAEASKACAHSGATAAAAQLAAEERLLAAQLGIAAQAGNPAQALPPLPAGFPAEDLDPVPVPWQGHGLAEDGLTGYEERRHAGRWYEAGSDVHVGRERPKDTSGQLDRYAHQVHAYVRGAAPVEPGAWTFRTRVHFTTSFVSGCLVLGSTRRDRNVRVHFSAGDFQYAIGRKDSAAVTEAVHLRVEGLWPRDGHLPRPAAAVDLKFPQPVSSFLLEAEVDGPRLVVRVDGTQRLVYGTPDRAPIAGTIGLAMGQGAVRLQEPEVQRRDASRLFAPDLDLLDGVSARFEDLLVRPVRGVPLAPHGTILVWVPLRKDAPAHARSHALRLAENLRRSWQDALRYPQRFVFVLPHECPEAERAGLAADLEALGGERLGVVTRRRTAPFGKDPWLLFVDGQGILRAGVEVFQGAGLAAAVEAWAKQWRAPWTGPAPAAPRTQAR
ncbi:MAG: hypothetical protein IT458_15705 [Planctomycetes bacterium]|nr:hypothetical protein [Planctomycetota bacterium]